MNKVIRHILPILCGSLLVIGMSCAFIAGKVKRSSMKCERLEVTILDSLKNSFVSESDVKKYLDREYGTYVGMPLDSLDLVKMEKILDGRSSVLKSQAYVTKDGALHIDIIQRSPVVRFQKKDGGFYADAEGYIFPLQNTYASHVQVIDGDIPLAANSGYKGDIENAQEKAWFKRIMNVVNYMENSKVWKGKIVQIHVQKNGELILIPRVGKERFLFGQPDSINEKFSKMERYYTTIVPEKGSDRYKTVDVRFSNQIVCK